MSNRAAIIRAENPGKTITRRGRNFIEFDDGGGKKRLVATVEPLHLRSSETEIDTGWTADTGAWQWKLNATDYQAHARSVFNVGNIYEWRQGSDWIIFDPQSINWVNQDYSRQQIAIKQAITGQVSGDTLSFPNAYGAGRHFSYTAHPSRLIKLITIDSLASLPAPTVTGTIHFEAEFSISTSTGLQVWLDGVQWTKENGVRVKTANRIEFRNAAGAVLWYADAPYATGSDLSRHGANQVQAEYEVRRQGGPSSLFITVRVPRTWIVDAAFPIFIDPTLTTQPDATAGVDTMLDVESPTTNFGTNAKMTSGNWDSAQNGRSRALVKFDLSSIASGSTIDSATLSLWHFAEYAVNSRTHYWYRLKRAWSESQATWNIYSTGNNWGTAGAIHADDAEATDIGGLSLSDTESNGEKQWTLTASAIEEMITGGSWTNNGFILRTATIPTETVSDEHEWRSSDYATAGERPKLVVVYTEGASGVNVSASEAVGVAESVSLATSAPSPAVSDAVGVAESVAARPQIGASASDAIGVAETASATVGAPGASASDAIGVADTASAAVGSPQVTAQEAAGVVDAATVSVTPHPALEVAASDAVGVADTASAAVGSPQVAGSESIGVADTTTVAVGESQIAVSDAVGVADTASAEVLEAGQINVSASESAGVAEAVAVAVGEAQIAVSDAIGVADTTTVSVEALGTLNVTVSDGAAVADTASAATGAPGVSASEAAGAAVMVAMAVDAPNVSVSDAIGVADTASASVAAPGQIDANVSDSAGVSDTATVEVSAPQVTVSEAVGVGESVSVSVVELGTLTITVSDGAAVADTAALETSAPQVTAAESAGVAESVGVAVLEAGAIGVTVSDYVGVSEAVSVAMGSLEIAVSDTAGAADVATASISGTENPVCLTLHPRSWSLTLNTRSWSFTLEDR